MLMNGLRKLEGRVMDMSDAVLLDTSFFIRFLNTSDPLYKNADDYFKYFLQKDIKMLISTISIAEFCTLGSVDQLPLLNLQILPFNIQEAQKTGEFAKIVFNHKGTLQLDNRNIIPNDSKLFAQAHVNTQIKYYLTSDTKSLDIYNLLNKSTSINFEFIDLHYPFTNKFGVLF